MNSYCAVIPHYEHVAPVSAVVDALRALDLEVIVVDDGSAAAQRLRLREMLEGRPGVRLIWRVRNAGKGAAVKDGLRAAWLLGYGHALQIDADGQHRVSDAPLLLERSRRDPAALICALPLFDATAPRSRRYGRKLTNFWVAVETWSTDVREAMCGFRIYPLATIVPLLGMRRSGDRMDFDIEVLVRARWANLTIDYVATPVVYPAGGVSHFRMLRDNALITRCHVRLVLGMLWRLPSLLVQTWRALARTAST